MFPDYHSVSADSTLLLSPEAVDFFCTGNIDVMLIELFYLQVQCQANDSNFIQTLQKIAKVGLNKELLGQLYAGAAPAAAFSLLVGPVYFASYGFAKREASRWICPSISAQNAEEGTPDRKKSHNKDAQAGAHGWLFVNLFASLVSGIAVSVVEAPAELLRHQAQVWSMFQTSLVVVSSS